MGTRSHVTKTKQVRSDLLTMSRKAKKSRKKRSGTGHWIWQYQMAFTQVWPQSDITDLRGEEEVFTWRKEQNCFPSGEVSNWRYGLSFLIHYCHVSSWLSTFIKLMKMRTLVDCS